MLEFPLPILCFETENLTSTGWKADLMEITVSLLLSRREHSIMMLVFLSPVVLFVSGMSWPASSLPPMLYRLTHVFPSTSVIPAYLRISSMGATLKDVRSELLFLIGQMFVYGALSMLNYRIYLHRKNVTQISLLERSDPATALNE